MNETHRIDNTEDVIDSREVIERLEWLRGELDDESETPTHNLTDEEVVELEALDALTGEGEGVEDWQYGATLIRDSYFQDYAQELAEEIGATGSPQAWPMYCIDWSWAAQELRMDYTSVDFDGVTYWVR